MEASPVVRNRREAAGGQYSRVLRTLWAWVLLVVMAALVAYLTPCPGVKWCSESGAPDFDAHALEPGRAIGQPLATEQEELSFVRFFPSAPLRKASGRVSVLLLKGDFPPRNKDEIESRALRSRVIPAGTFIDKAAWQWDLGHLKPGNERRFYFLMIPASDSFAPVSSLGLWLSRGPIRGQPADRLTFGSDGALTAEPLESQVALAVGLTDGGTCLGRVLGTIWAPIVLAALFAVLYLVEPLLTRVVNSPWTGQVGLHLVLAGIAMVLVIYVSTGTLSPYSATREPLEITPCLYTVNWDYRHFLFVFRMLAGLPPAEWQNSEVLHRILYPALAYPFVKAMGPLVGGAVFNTLLHAAALVSWGLFLLKTVGRRGALAGIWLLATYPGIAYWGGLPFCYAFIVPATLWAFMLLSILEDVDRPASVFLISAGLGILGQGYDVMAFFGPAAMIVVLLRTKRILTVTVAAAGMLLPYVITCVILLNAYDVYWMNGNNLQYWKILRAWLSPGDSHAWGALLLQVPMLLVANFLDSSFAALPVLFLALAVLNRGTWRVPFQRAEVALLVIILAVFLFNNLAPPYEGWQMRGEAMARLYQPLLVVLLFFAVRKCEHASDCSSLQRGTILSACVACVIFNALVCFGPIVCNWSASSTVYHRFYVHAYSDSYSKHLEGYGRRPLGFCNAKEKASHGARDEYLGIPF